MAYNGGRSLNNGVRNGGNNDDIYKQLIDNNDLVRELDDIEAISQQISQHAEVLYQSWKNNQQQQVPEGATPPVASQNHEIKRQPSLDSARVNGHDHVSPAGRQRPLNSGSDLSSPSYISMATGSLTNGSKSSTIPKLSRSMSTPTEGSVNFESSNGRSMTLGRPDQNDKKPLDLIVNQEMNGNLKDLVNSFVSTDRAKQAARLTIANTINNQRRNGIGFRSPSPSSSSSPFSSRAVSPLRSPILASNVSGQGSHHNSSLTGSQNPMSPSRLSQSSSSTSVNGSTNSDHQNRSDPHIKLSPMFKNPVQNVPGSNSLPENPSWPSETNSISIPVVHVSSKSKDEGLKSTEVMHAIKPREHPFNSFPSPTNVHDMHQVHMDNMRQKFEQAKQRMNLLHHRAGQMPKRNSIGDPFESSIDVMDSADHSSFLFDQFKRRVANRPKPSAPHPELTPQQRQHINERTPTLTPMRRYTTGGSVADRVMMFERAPILGSDPALTNRFPQTSQPEKKKEQPNWKIGLPDPTNRLNRPVGGNTSLNQPIIRTIPIITPVSITTSSKTSPTISTSQPTKTTSTVAVTTATPRFTSTLSSSPKPSIRSESSQPTLAKISPFLNTSPVVSKISSSSVITPVSTTTANFGESPANSSTATTPKTSPCVDNQHSKATPSVTTKSLLNVSADQPRPISQVIPRPITQLPSQNQPKSRPNSILVTGKEKVLPRFHFPHGNPSTLNPYSNGNLEQFVEEFRKHKNASVNLEEFGEILKKCGYATCWKTMVFSLCVGKQVSTSPQSHGDETENGETISSSTPLFNSEKLSLSLFSDFWRRLATTYHDESSQFIYIVTQASSLFNNVSESPGSNKSSLGINGKYNPPRNYIVPEDLITLIQDVVDSHPGLGFLKEATEFHSRYVHTVIARIFYVVNRSWSGRLTAGELRKSNFLATLKLLDDEEDINAITDFFSYEHFYVIYCKFWELDKDHDLFIDREDLARHNDHAISTRMIDRIFSGTVTQGLAQKEGKMSYTEFVWFLLAEEDKRNPTSIEYWFRCMDLDGDGYLSMYELEYFYEEQLQRMEQLGIETLPFEDCLCQMLDMIGPKSPNMISLSDLRSCPMTPIFFDTFFNLEKYLDHEQRDPFASQRELDEDGNEIMSDWDRFAAEEYELLVAEEGNAEGAMDDLCYDDDGETNPEMLMEQALDNEMLYQEQMDKT